MNCFALLICCTMMGQATAKEENAKALQFAKQVESSVPLELTKIGFFPNSAETLQLVAYAGIIVRGYRVNGKPQLGRQKAMAILSKLDNLVLKRKSVAAAFAAGSIRRMMVVDLVKGNEKSKADLSSQQRLKLCRQKVKAKPGAVIPIIQLALAMDARGEVMWWSHAAGAHEAQLKFVEFVTKSIGKHPKDFGLKTIYYDRCAYVLHSLTRFNYSDRVEHQFDLLDKFVRKQKETATMAKLRQRMCSQIIKATKKLQVESQARRKLIGQPVHKLPLGEWVVGKAVTQPQLKNKVVVLDFWGLTCAPCLRQLPKLHSWQKDYEQQGLVLLGLSQVEPVSWDKAKNQIRYVRKSNRAQCADALKQFAVKRKINHPLLLMHDKDANPNLKTHFRVNSVPQLIIVDRKGIVRGIWVGGDPSHLAAAESLIRKLLKD